VVEDEAETGMLAGHPGGLRKLPLADDQIERQSLLLERGESAADVLDPAVVATTARGVVVVPPRD
jgi:hypothetical protein